MRVKFIPDLSIPHAPWQTGEVLTVQITAANQDGSYECETIETFPPDLKDQHRAQVEAIHLAYETKIAKLVEGANDA